VAEERKETHKILLNEYNYKDIGTREINSRLQHSPTGQNKILLIKNIERMTISAINAFLKACEEPLPNRIIIATTANKSQILDTVISRAITIDSNKNEDSGNQNKHDFTQDLAAVSKLLATDSNIHNKHKILSEINKR
jgi:DNA polymerase III delta prime subunit